MLRCVFIVECGITRFLCAMRVFEVRASSLSPRLPLCANFVAFAASIAEIAHGEKSRTQSLTHPAHLILGKQSFRFEIALPAKLYLLSRKSRYRLRVFSPECWWVWLRRSWWRAASRRRTTRRRGNARRSSYSRRAETATRRPGTFALRLSLTYPCRTAKTSTATCVLICSLSFVFFLQFCASSVRVPFKVLTFWRRKKTKGLHRMNDAVINKKDKSTKGNKVSNDNKQEAPLPQR